MYLLTPTTNFKIFEFYDFWNYLSFKLLFVVSRYKLPESIIGACHKSLRCADVVGVVHDVSNRYTRDSLHIDVVSLLESVEDIPSFLILNKVGTAVNNRYHIGILWPMCVHPTSC